MPQGDSQTLELVESVSSLNRTLRQLAHLGEGGQKVGFAAMGVLLYVYRNQPTRATDVAQWIGIGPAALSRQVADLESMGLLERTPCRNDARAQLISLTQEGKDEVDRAYKRRTDLLSDLLKDWDADGDRRSRGHREPDPASASCRHRPDARQELTSGRGCTGRKRMSEQQSVALTRERQGDQPQMEPEGGDALHRRRSGRILRGDAGHHHRFDRPADHHGRPQRHADRLQLGPHRGAAGQRRHHPDLGQAGRPFRQEEAAAAWHPHLRCGFPAGGVRDQHPHAHERPRHPGHRHGRAHRHGHGGDRHRHPAARARTLLGLLRRRHGAGHGRRTAAGRA